MQIVLPGALPEPPQARALAPHVYRAAPTLQRWRACGRVRTTTAMIAQTGCTAYEQWQLQQRGFTPAADQNLSAGLAALLAGPAAAANEPVWLAELVHIALASDGATLVPARRLDLNEADSRALLTSAQALCDGSGFTLAPHSVTHWRVMPLDPAFSLRCASPERVAASSLHDWWPQESGARAWRQLFNTLQMHWFDHPVNQARAARNLPPVNGLWLFGGAHPAQLHAESADAPQVYDNLVDPWLAQDWGAWLEALAELERTVFAPLARAPDALVLIGEEEILTVGPAARWQFWRGWFRSV